MIIMIKKAIKFEITDMEGSKYLIEKYEGSIVSSWEEINESLQLIAKDMEEGIGGIKIFITISFEDGKTYSAKYFLKKADNPDLKKHIYDFAQAYSGRKKPLHLTKDQYESFLQTIGEDEKENFTKLLDGYDIIPKLRCEECGVLKPINDFPKNSTLCFECSEKLGLYVVECAYCHKKGLADNMSAIDLYNYPPHRNEYEVIYLHQGCSLPDDYIYVDWNGDIIDDSEWEKGVLVDKKDMEDKFILKGGKIRSRSFQIHRKESDDDDNYGDVFELTLGKNSNDLNDIVCELWGSENNFLGHIEGLDNINFNLPDEVEIIFDKPPRILFRWDKGVEIKKKVIMDNEKPNTILFCSPKKISK